MTSTSPLSCGGVSAGLAAKWVVGILVELTDAVAVIAIFVHLEGGPDQELAGQLLDGVLNSLGGAFEARVADRTLGSLAGE